MSQNSSASVAERPWLFKPGVSANPGGKPKIPAEVVELARTYTPRAIHRLGEIMESKNERAATAAAIALLDRAWGKPAMSFADEGGEPLSILHLVAARHISEQLQAEMAETRAVSGSASEKHPVIDLAAWEKLPPALE